MKKDEIVYDFAKEFTKTPGPRYESLGEFSGERFRDEVLTKLLDEYQVVKIDGSGITTSFSPSFLSEAFGNFVRKLGIDEFFKRVQLSSTTNEKLKEKFKYYASLESR